MKAEESQKTAQPFSVAALWWYAQRWIMQVGFAGWAGLALLVLALAALLAIYLPAQREAERLEAELADLSVTAASSASLREAAPRTEVEQLDEFYQRFPADSEIAGELARIQAAATRNGVVLARGEFKLGGDSEGSGARVIGYQMLLPVRAEYRKTRAFVREVLRTVPEAAIEEVSFKREDAGNAVPETRLRIVLYLRTDAS